MASSVQQPAEAFPAFSALVAAWNEAHMIERHVASFLALCQHDSELILCAGGADGTYDRARLAASNATNVLVLEQRPGQGKQSALRACWEHASQSWVYLTDADCLFSERVLRSLFDATTKGISVVTGGSRPLPEQMTTPLVAYQAARDAAYDAGRGDSADGILGRNALFHRDLIEAAGAFSTPVRTGTDYHLSLQLNALNEPIAYARDAAIASEYPASPPAYLRMWRRWIKNRLVHAPRANVGSLAVSLGLALAMLAAPVAAMALRSWPLAGLALGLLALASWARLRGLPHIDDAAAAMRLPVGVRIPGYVYLDQLAVVLAWADALTDRGRGRW